MKKKQRNTVVIWVVFLVITAASVATAGEILSLGGEIADIGTPLFSLEAVSEPTAPPPFTELKPPAKDAAPPTDTVSTTWGAQPPAVPAKESPLMSLHSADMPGQPGHQTTPYVVTYLFFDGQNEREISIVVLEDQGVPIPLYEPAREGYTFAFWYDADADLDVNGNVVEFVFGRAPTRNITLRAYFVQGVADVAGTPEKPKWAEQPSLNIMAQGEDTIWELFSSNDGAAKFMPPAKGDIGLTPEDLLGGMWAGQAPVTVLEQGDANIWDLLGEKTADGGPVAVADPMAALLVLEDGAVPLAGPGPEITVNITCDASGFVQYGDMITLYARATGLEGMWYTAAWRYYDGLAWHEAQSGTSLAYQYRLNEENYTWTWEVEITFQQ